MTKTCTKCGETKPLSEFGRRAKSEDGLNYWCRDCCSKQHKEYYEQNAEAQRARTRKYDAEHREERIAYAKKYNAEHAEERSAYSIQYRAEHKEATAAGHLRRTYGITLDDYDAMLETQGGGCAICGKMPEEHGARLHVDHDHETDEVRGLLCRNCNAGLGWFLDSPGLCKTAMLYLQKYGKEEAT